MLKPGHVFESLAGPGQTMLAVAVQIGYAAVVFFSSMVEKSGMSIYIIVAYRLMFAAVIAVTLALIFARLSAPPIFSARNNTTQKGLKPIMYKQKGLDYNLSGPVIGPNLSKYELRLRDHSDVSKYLTRYLSPEQYHYQIKKLISFFQIYRECRPKLTWTVLFQAFLAGLLG